MCVCVCMCSTSPKPSIGIRSLGQHAILKKPIYPARLPRLANKKLEKATASQPAASVFASPLFGGCGVISLSCFNVFGCACQGPWLRGLRA